MNKTTPEWLIFFAGLHSFAFAIFHIFFWRIFQWKTELKKVHFATQAVTQILNIQLIFYFFITALICFIFPNELISTSFGRFICAGYGLFWLVRLIQQPIFLKVNVLMVHILSVLFALGSALFLLTFWVHD